MVATFRRIPMFDVEGRRIEIRPGDVVQNAVGRVEQLFPCEWEAAQFRFPHWIQGWETKHALAVNIEVTGRTFQQRNVPGWGGYWVKVRIEWVGDGEPSQFSPGWLRVTPWDWPLVKELKHESI